MLGEDNSLGGAALAVLTIVSLDIGLGHLKRLVPALDRLLEGDAILLVKNARPDEQALAANALDHADILAAARSSHGLTSLDEIREAVLEKDGKISIVPSGGPK